MDNTTTKTILSYNNGQEVTLRYTSDIEDAVDAIVAACAINEDGVIQAWDAAKIFTRPEPHTAMTEYTALLAAGCTEEPNVAQE